MRVAGRTRNACLQSRGRGEELLWPSAHCPPGKTHSFLGHPTAVKSQSRLCPPDSLLGSPASAKGCTRQTPAEVTPKGWENSPGVGGSQPRPDSPPLRAPLQASGWPLALHALHSHPGAGGRGAGLPPQPFLAPAEASALASGLSFALGGWVVCLF